MMVIGLHTCNRLDFTQKTVETLIEHNPEVAHFTWVIVDDCSNHDTLDYLDYMELTLPGRVIVRRIEGKRKGITFGLKCMVDIAVDHGNVMLYLQNDWRTSRKIDFNAIDKFITETKGVGHIRTVVYKGLDGERAASRNNLATREPIKFGRQFKIGKEELYSGNWHYSDLPGFIHLGYARRMFKKITLNGQQAGNNEQTRIFNIEFFGCKNYLLRDQPFWNLDWNKNRQTPGGRVK